MVIKLNSIDGSTNAHIDKHTQTHTHTQTDTHTQIHTGKKENV